jgi:hypothetical protein
MLETIVYGFDLLFINFIKLHREELHGSYSGPLNKRTFVQALQLRRCRGTKAEKPGNEGTEKTCAFYVASASGHVNITMTHSPSRQLPNKGVEA